MTDRELRPIFVGIDGGGTRTRAVAINDRGSVVGRAEGGSINRNHHSEEEVRTVLADILARCCPSNEPPAGLLIGTSGILTPEDFEAVRQSALSVPIVASAGSLWVEHDTFVALVGGLDEEPGIILISGTGTACYGRNRAGKTWLSSGWGALVDDAGSAYWMGIEALRYAARSDDGRYPPTILRERCFGFLGLPNPRALLDRLHNGGISRERIAQLARTVIRSWEEGDWAAAEIVERGIDELTLCVRAVRERLFPAPEVVPIVLVGGLATSGAPFTPRLEARLTHDAGVVSRPPLHTPEEGAALEARRRYMQVAASGF